jgi:cyclopropane fatty-acyl-phospholipid synthase-like methyltransferase
MLAGKPFSESCEQNKAVILEVLQRYLRAGDRVLEIGSGTGQHAVYFGRALSDVQWQTSDCAEYLPGIRAWLDDAGLANVAAPLTLDVRTHHWPVQQAGFQAVFTANTAHIMSWPAVIAMFNGVGRLLPAGGLFLQYGPFSYAGQHSSTSNARFEQWLKARDPQSGVRDLDDLKPLAADSGLQLQADIEMPVNNRMLVWQRVAAE